MIHLNDNCNAKEIAKIFITSDETHLQVKRKHKMKSRMREKNIKFVIKVRQVLITMLNNTTITYQENEETFLLSLHCTAALAPQQNDK